MELNQDQMDKLADMVLEKALVRLPSVLGALMQNQAATFKLVKDFYDAHPELKEHRGVVARAIEKTELDNPGKRYEEILEVALPRIKEELRMQSKLSFERPSLGDLNLSVNPTSNGVL